MICALAFTAHYVYHAIVDRPQEDAYYEWLPSRFKENMAREEWEYERERERENPEGIIAFEDDNGKCVHWNENVVIRIADRSGFQFVQINRFVGENADDSIGIAAEQDDVTKQIGGCC